MRVLKAASELGQCGGRVNAIRPGLVPTDASSVLDGDEATRQDYLDQIPLGHTGETPDIGAAVRYLVGDDSRWVTGPVFGVDGGHTLRRGPDRHSVIVQHCEGTRPHLMTPAQGSAPGHVPTKR